MGEEKRHQLMQNLFGDQSEEEEEEEEVDSEHESNPQPNSDYNNKMAQLRAGQSSKSKLTIVKTLEPVDGWEVRQGTYFQDVVASKYDGGMDAKFEYFTRDAVFSGYVYTRGGYIELSEKLSLPLGQTLNRYMPYLHSQMELLKLKAASQNEIHGG